MLVQRGVVVDVQERTWEMDGRSGSTTTVYLRDSADELSRFAAQPVKLGKVKAGDSYVPIEAPQVGDEVEYRVRLDFRTDNEGRAKLTTVQKFGKPAQEQQHGYEAVEEILIREPVNPKVTGKR